MKPEPTKVRSFFEATPAARPDPRGEVTWSQGAFAASVGQDPSQVLRDSQRRPPGGLPALAELHASGQSATEISQEHSVASPARQRIELGR